MRIFWIVLLAVIASAAALVFTGETNESPATVIETAGPASTPDRPRTETVAPAPEQDQASLASTTAETIAEEAIEQAPVAETPAIESIEAPALAIEEAATASAETADAEENEPALASITADDITEALADANAASAPAENAPTGWDALAKETDAPAGTSAPIEAPTEAPAEAPAVVHLDVTQLDDGRIQIGDAFTIAGKGTKEEPYALPWDFLVAIREAYSPRDGRKDIPDHFAFFEGKYVAVRGYLQFPLANPEPTECLVMLNQWDGCCIGVPPTPYDAIEVALSTPATQAQKFAVEGRIVGRLDIDPYLVGNWLIGLYLLGDATVDVAGSRSAEEVYGNTPSQMIPGQ